MATGCGQKLLLVVIGRRVGLLPFMLNELTPTQQRLASYMSELSELAYSAGWMTGLEVALWQALPDKLFKYGRLELTTAHLTRLHELSNECGGWICFDEKREESFVSFVDWQRRLAQVQGQITAS